MLLLETRPLLSHTTEIDEDERSEKQITYDEAIHATGYGSFHYLLLLVLGMANASDAIELLCVSLLLPAAQCDLQMDSSQKGWLNATVFIGMMIGGFIWGSLGDIYGRKSVLILALMINGLAGIMSSLAQSYALFLAFRFVSGLGVGGSIPLVWSYTSEFQPSEKRGMALSVVACFWMWGNVIVAALGYAIIPRDFGYESIVGDFSFSSWRIFMVVCALPSLVVCIALMFFPESPMYLLQKGEGDKAINILEHIFAWNNSRLPNDYPIHSITSSFTHNDSPPCSSPRYTRGSFNPVSSITIVTRPIAKSLNQTKCLFSSSLATLTMLMVAINFAIQFGYFGLWLWFPEIFNRLQLYHNEHPYDKVGVCSLPSSSYTPNPNSTFQLCPNNNSVDNQVLLNTLLISFSPLPTNLWTVAHMDKLGRKFFLVLSMVLSGATAFAIYLVKSSMENLILSCVFGAISTMGFSALDCLGAELFPTKLRSTALAVTLVAARMGAICGSVVFGYLLDTHCVVPMILVAGLLIGGGLLGLLLPNTTNTPLG